MTTKLWIQYFDMITIIKHFNEAERSGNWKLHFDALRRMNPYFHVSGYYLYIKPCQLYLQDMYAVARNTDILHVEKFSGKRFFTARRLNKFWSGITSNVTIE